MLGGAFVGIFHHAPAAFVIVGMAAVFGGAARVPIAMLLMVAEMTGGYQLLVPAGLAVMLSFLIQIKFSSFFKYGSLYEAQVAGRIDSPAHRSENVQIAVRLLDEGKVSLPPQINHLGSRSPSSVGCRIGSSRWLADNGWRASARESLGGKANSVPLSRRGDRRRKDHRHFTR